MLQQGLQANQSDNRRCSLYTFFFCVLLVAVCYANSVTNAFILDDVLIVAANERIRSVQPIQFLFQPYWQDREHAGIYRPLTIFSFSLEYYIWKAWAPGFRLTNLLLHALNGWLVFLIVRGLLGSPLAAWASAALYLAHPVQTEAVVSIVGRSELLAATLFFAAWLAFRNGRTAWSCLAYLLAILAKESAITLPAIAALDLALSERSIHKLIESWKRFAALAACGVAYLALRFYVLGGLGVPASGQYLQGAWMRGQLLLTSGRVFLEYLRLLFAPVNVTGDYDFNSIPLATVRDWDAWLGLTLILACVSVALWNTKKRPGISLSILFFFVALLPVSNWIMPIALLMAERFLYTPVFGFSLLVGMCWAAIPTMEIRRVTAIGILAIAALLCISHNYIWQDTLTFHTNVVRLLPDNARARLGYGYALMRLGKFEEAHSQFEEGLRILPKSAPLLAGLAGAVMQTDGQCARVRPILDQTFAVAPGQWQGLWILGDCFVTEGNLQLAERSYGLAVKNAPFPDGRLLISWGNTLERMGNVATAQAAYERGIRIDPTLFRNGRPIEILQYAQPAGTNATPDPTSSSWLRSES